MEDISLQNFSSILEILSVYYIGAATSESFKNFFGINETFGNALKKNELFKVLKDIPTEDLKTNGSSLTNQELEKKTEESKRIYKIFQTSLEVTKLVDVKYNFLDSPNLFNCMRPFYIYFGVCSFGLLLLGGILKEWHRLYSLVFLNTSSIIVALILIYKLFKVGDIYRHWGVIKAFVLSSFFIILFISVPESCASSHFNKITPPNSFQTKHISLSYADFHTILCILLLFVPIIAHMGCLVYLMGKIYFLKSRLIKYGVLSKEIVETQNEIKLSREDFFTDIQELKK